MEWIVIFLVILNIIPLKWLKFLGTQNLHRHLSALTMLIAFTQLYMLLVLDFILQAKEIGQGLGFLA